MTETAVTIPQSDLEAIERSYIFRGHEEVIKFISKYPFLVPVLVEAPTKIRHYFPDSQLFLEVVYDPEMSNWVQLVLSIQISLDPYLAVERENQLDKDWWLDFPHEVHKQLCTLLEYPDDF